MHGIEIRAARSSDLAEMTRLFAALGYPMDQAVLAERFEAYERAGDRAIVAVRTGDDSVTPSLLGLATLHATPVLHRAGAVGRVTALVVDPDARGHGIGRALMDEAERWAAARGCVLMEVTSNRRRTEAHAFYERLGYVATSFRFAKDLARDGQSPSQPA